MDWGALIIALCALGVLVVDAVIFFMLGAASVKNDPYNFKQPTKLETYEHYSQEPTSKRRAL